MRNPYQHLQSIPTLIANRMSYQNEFQDLLCSEGNIRTEIKLAWAMSDSDIVHINGCAVITHTHSQSSARYRECLTGKPIHDKGRKKQKTSFTPAGIVILRYLPQEYLRLACEGKLMPRMWIVCPVVINIHHNLTYLSITKYSWSSLVQN